MLSTSCAKPQDVITCVILRTQSYKPLHIKSTLMYIYGCNKRFYNTCILSYFINKEKDMGELPPQKNDIHDILTYCTCDQ